MTVDHAGRETRTLWVKGSGTDLATITPPGFPALRLDEVLPLRERATMDDAEMVDYLRRCGLVPEQPRPSIETLLHAFVPSPQVDHTHPDAIIALTSSPDGRALAEAAFGDEAVWLDYQRPGFDMSRRIAELLEENPAARAVLLAKHGLVTWGETGEESYRGTIEFVTRAAEAIDGAAGHGYGLGGPRVRTVSDDEADDLLAATLPALRGALGAGLVLEVDRTHEAVAFASAARTPEVSQIGAPCPDHLINTKHKPLVVDFDPARDGAAELAAAFRSGVEAYAAWYREYYERNVDDETRPFPMDPPGPRVVLIPGVGLVTSGADTRRARIARDLYHRAIVVEDAADALGGFSSLSEAEAFKIEYWPLERYKLAQLPPPSDLSGRIALITGGASGIGRATARRLAELGAHVAVADLNASGATEVAAELVERYGEGRAIGLPLDVTDEAAMAEAFRATVLAWGGLDILVCSAGIASSAPITETTLELWERNYAVLARGYFLASRAGFEVLREQGTGGSIVFVGLQERPCRRRQRRRLLVGEGRVAAPRALPGRGGRGRLDPRQHGQPGRGHRRLRALVVRLEGRACEHVRHRCRGASSLLPRQDAARSQCLPRGRRRGDRVPGRAALRQVHGQCRQRRRGRHRRLPAVTPERGGVEG